MIDTRAVARMLDEHMRGGRDRSAQIWALVCFEEWARRWLDRTAEAPARVSHGSRDENV